MSESHERSPDWLREFQAPDRDVMSLSSASDSSPERPSHTLKDGIERGKDKAEPLSIDSGDDVPKVQAKKKKSTQTETTSVSLEDALDTQEEGLAEGDLMKEKTEGPSVSQRLPLVLPEKVQRTKALVECDGDSIDLSGDVGAVGRLVISNGPNARDDLLLDLKGTIYKSAIVPSRTFCIVSVGQTEAKIEAIMNDFIQLEPQSNLFEAETMVEGTLDGFLFDSDEEGDKVTEANPKEKNNGNGDQPTSKKTKRKNDQSPLSCCRLEACQRRRRKLQPNRVSELQEKHNLLREPRKLASELLKDTNYSLYCILARVIFLDHSATQGCLSF